LAVEVKNSAKVTLLSFSATAVFPHDVGEGGHSRTQSSFFIYSKCWKRRTLKYPWWLSLIPAVVLKWIFPW